MILQNRFSHNFQNNDQKDLKFTHNIYLGKIRVWY